MTASTTIVHLLCGSVAFAMVVAAGQPIVSDDLWLHLALGSQYAEHGPFLTSEPFLHTATAAPAPHGWVADIFLDWIVRHAGFGGLRILHAALVVWILALVWRIVARDVRQPVAASLTVASITVLAAYRMVQLRPQIFSMVAVLLLYSIFLRRSCRPGAWHLGAVALLCCLWANVHAAFVLGPILIAAAAAGVLCIATISPGEDRRLAWVRGRSLLALGLAAALGACLNPAGPAQLLLYLTAGDGTATLQQVGDEWAAFPFLGWPGGNVPPTPFTWTVATALFFGAGAIVVSEAIATIRRARSNESPTASPTIDPALIGLAAASLVAMATAVRFLWLGFFPLLLVAVAAERAIQRRPGRAKYKNRLALALAGAIAVGFFTIGPWLIVGQFSRGDWSGYARTYPPQRYYAHAVWFLSDAALEGRAFNPYYMGNFLAYWTTPKLRVFVNGSLGMSDEIIDASREIVSYRPSRPDESLTELLDRHGVDVFVGVGLPDTPRSRRPWHYSTTHLEGDPNWISVYRNFSSAVYLRRSERNRANLGRVEAYYRRHGVPFDRTRGFEPERALTGAPRWALEQGIVPRIFHTAEAAAWSREGHRRDRARRLLASIYLTLGLYERSIELDRNRDPASQDVRAQRRLVWALLRSGRRDEARKEAEYLESLANTSDRLSLGIVDTARSTLGASEREITARVARLPLFEPAETQLLLSTVAAPEVRPARQDIMQAHAERARADVLDVPSAHRHE